MPSTDVQITLHGKNYIVHQSLPKPVACLQQTITGGMNTNTDFLLTSGTNMAWKLEHIFSDMIHYEANAYRCIQIHSHRDEWNNTLRFSNTCIQRHTLRIMKVTCHILVGQSKDMNNTQVTGIIIIIQTEQNQIFLIKDWEKDRKRSWWTHSL